MLGVDAWRCTDESGLSAVCELIDARGEVAGLARLCASDDELSQRCADEHLSSSENIYQVGYKVS